MKLPPATWWLNAALARDHGETTKHYIWYQKPDKAAVFSRLAAHHAGLELERRAQENGQPELEAAA